MTVGAGRERERKESFPLPIVLSDYVPFFILTKCHWGRPFLFRKGPGAVRISMAGLSLLQSAS